MISDNESKEKLKTVLYRFNEHFEGDVPLCKVGVVEIQLPYRSGRDIVKLANSLGLNINYGGATNGYSRWQYVNEFISYAVDNDKIPDLMSTFINRNSLMEYVEVMKQEKTVEDTYNYIIKNIIDKFNYVLADINYCIIYGNNKFKIQHKESDTYVDLPEDNILLDNINAEYDRIRNCIDNEDYDTAISKSSKILEEVLLSKLSSCKYDDKPKGLRELYKKFKEEYKLNNKTDLNVNIVKLLGGLETIVQSISDMRNNYSDAHAQIKKVKIKRREAVLVLNSTITSITYILEMEIKCI